MHVKTQNWQDRLSMQFEGDIHPDTYKQVKSFITSLLEERDWGLLREAEIMDKENSEISVAKGELPTGAVKPIAYSLVRNLIDRRDSGLSDLLEEKK